LLRVCVLRDVMAVLLGEQCAAFWRTIMCSLQGQATDYLHRLTLKMEASRSFRTSGTTCQMNWYYIPEGLN